MKMTYFCITIFILDDDLSFYLRDIQFPSCLHQINCISSPIGWLAAGHSLIVRRIQMWFAML